MSKVQKKLDAELDAAIKRAAEISGKREKSKEPNNSQRITTTVSDANAADPLATISEFHENISWFNGKMRWLRNAFNRASASGSKIADVSLYIWERGLGQTCKFVVRAGIKIGKGYARFFNWASYKKDKSKKRVFSKWRASLAVAAAALSPIIAWHSAPFATRIGYDFTMRAVSERHEKLYLYNSEPIPDDPHNWFVSASKSRDERDVKSSQKMVIRNWNLAYLRLAAESQRIEGAIAEEPELFDVTVTGWRFRLPFGYLIDLFPEIQDVKQIPDPGKHMPPPPVISPTAPDPGGP